ncbi:MAG: TIGR03960 family B12-binding radical SAM protein [Nitrospirae bacterium]|uniref:TIGR03960 family B12-binding radical SAM protein n=1 Tax=Candidatus Magnetobacterium casense TaxID=1455061 RepID=UPI0006970500|nr:TIGR03960 family B12-binding radical SAM protein [Candidatus Magnetobacterium casensis]MBF0336246.1 TIGR03960 family B12-binding radical SAM protein [Nitrospirota bacterium]
MNFSQFRRPSRYINSELNAVYKRGFIRVALCFPDVYEIGMSHLGLKLLYKIINDLPYASCERAFAPWTDLEEYLKTEGILLTSLESKTPLREFDIVGFSLQYELSYTTVLNMLHLGGIPIRAQMRSDTDPVVIAGGPCTVNPSPVLPFFDAFVIGDAEETIREVIDVGVAYKKDGHLNRKDFLKGLSEIEGVMVPAFPKPSVRRRYVTNLDIADYPTAPVVPYTEVVHDRINIEIARGCSCGCRFCQAGVIYRPVRERDPATIITIAEQALKNTGYTEVSFTSLSAGDYTRLPEVLRLFNRKFSHRRISFSLPSLRINSVTEDIVIMTKAVKKSGFTIAAEAATARLRQVINKDFEQEDYDRTIHTIFREGWLNLKLYFMIALPTERDEDVEAIPAMVYKALKTANRFTKHSVNINVGVSAFIPKSHTPFQWCQHASLDEIMRKKDYLRQNLNKKAIKFKLQDDRMSLLEALFARGDQDMATLIETAWQEGARLDAWSDVFDYNKWLTAMDKTGIDGAAIATRDFHGDASTPLPWDTVDTGVSKDYLWRELQRALAENRTPDCKNTCMACGLGCKSGEYLSKCDGYVLPDSGSKPEFQMRHSFSPVGVRVMFSKGGQLRYLSHLELMLALLRGLLRASVPLVYSKGFNPMPGISFGPALSVGVAGEREFFDIEVYPPCDIEKFTRELNMTLPQGLSVLKMFFIPKGAPSLGKFVNTYRYEIALNKKLTRIDIENAIQLFLQTPENKWMTSNLVEFDTADDKLVLLLRDTPEKAVKIAVVVEALLGCKMEEVEVVRTAMYGWQAGLAGKGQDGQLKTGRLVQPDEIIPRGQH